MTRDTQISRPATTGQILSIANTVETEICKLLSADGRLLHKQAEKILKQKGAQAKIKRLARATVKEFFGVQISSFPEKTHNLVRLSGEQELILDACKGSDIITPDTREPFERVDPDFVNWEADEAGSDTPKMEVCVYEMGKDANFANLFGSFGVETDELCLTHSQIKNFSRKFRSWLCKYGYATFFLFKSKGKFFVAYVYLDDSGCLEVNVGRLEHDRVWYAGFRHRLVVPLF